MKEKETNPFGKENFFKSLNKQKQKTKKKNEVTHTGTVEAVMLGTNNAVPICAEACSCCWDKPFPKGFEKQSEYIAKRSRTGHTSITEHSNCVIYIKIHKFFEDSLADFLSICNYLQTKLYNSEDGEYWHMIIGGSYRGYADLYREINDINNPILKAITNVLYIYAPSSMFEDICELKLLNKDLFWNTEHEVLLTSDKTIDTDLFKIVGMDDPEILYSRIVDVAPELATLVDMYDIIKFLSITVLFKNMSRTCTHQLVRHRNAITQESQRYVDYSESCFSSPDMFKPERYDSEHKYEITFDNGKYKTELTLSELGDELCKIYGMLSNHDNISNGGVHLLKEDARAFLPSNVQCKKIYMTFTFKNLFKFLQLREDKAAQAEIRMYATELGEWFRSSNEVFADKEYCEALLQPRLLITDTFMPIAVENGIVEDTVITDEDYIKAAGLEVAEEEI